MVSLEFRRKDARKKAKAPPWGKQGFLGVDGGLGKALIDGSNGIEKGSPHYERVAAHAKRWPR